MLKFKIDSRNFTKRELKRLEDARTKLEVICNSELFRQEFLRADFSGETSKWKHKTNEEIYNHFMSGAEDLQPEVDHEADIDLTIFNPKPWSGTVGYTYRNTIRQWINRKFFWSLRIWGVMGNIAHEWGHKLGFGHDYKRTKRRPFSVCYQLNAIIKYCYSVMYEGNEPPVAAVKAYVPKWKRILFFWRY